MIFEWMLEAVYVRLLIISTQLVDCLLFFDFTFISTSSFLSLYCKLDESQII